jgi:soluble lytic murein transglycosylase-like protein
VLVFLLVAGGILAVLALVRGGGEPSREEARVDRATAANSRVLYEKSPGGAFATARRVERWRGDVERVADADGLDPDVLEGMVFLESAGYPDARASDDLEGAAGLTQILAETATSLLGMHVDLTASRRVTDELAATADAARARRLEARRRVVDERFDPRKALEGAGRYLQTAKERFGREDLAVVSYHMGIGNLESVLAAFGDRDASWATVYFESTPRRHRRAYRLLAGFGDDSASYLWRVYAARSIMRLYRNDPSELRERERRS